MTSKVKFMKINVKEETWMQMMKIKYEKRYKSIDELIQKECHLTCKR